MAHHLSIFMENQPGKLERITRILAEEKINLRAISLASGGDFGVLKILVTEPERAATVLREHKVTVSSRKIVMALIDDEPGGFHRVLELLSSNGLNLQDCYGFVLESRKTAAIVIEAENIPDAEQRLVAAGYQLLTDAEIYAL